MSINPYFPPMGYPDGYDAPEPAEPSEDACPQCGATRFGHEIRLGYCDRCEWDVDQPCTR